jgi:hypothetical protein
LRLSVQKFRRAFLTRLSAQRQAVPEFETNSQGCRLATSVGGVPTGRGACGPHVGEGPSAVLIEDKASGIQLIQELIRALAVEGGVDRCR